MEEESLGIKRESFATLPRNQKDLVLFDNIRHIIDQSKNTSVMCDRRKSDIRMIKTVGFIWLFALSVATGIRRFLPF